MKQIKIVARKEGRIIGSWELEPAAITIGRADEADIALPGDSVSRIHAIVEPLPSGALRVRDAASRNGVRVNGQRVDRAEIGPADEVAIERYILTCETLGPQPLRPPAPPASSAFSPAEEAPFSEAAHEAAYEDDEEDADLDLEPGFSLAEAVRGARIQIPRGSNEMVLEAVYTVGSQLRETQYVKPGGVLYDVNGQLIARADDLDKRRVEEVHTVEGTWLLRMVPPAVTETEEIVTIDDVAPQAKWALGMSGLSVGGHLVIMFVLLPLFMFVMAVFANNDDVKTDELDRFAEVQLEVPEPEKKEEPKKRKKEKKKKTPKKTKVAKAARTQAKPQTSRPTPASAGIAGALGKMDVKFNSSAPLLAAATNLRGVKVPGGGGYKVSGIAVKGKGVINGRPGGAFGSQDMGTLNGQIFGAKGGHGGIKKRGGGKIRGTVAAPPARKVGVKGHLDRSQIARVVNKHIHEIRHCYEKNLLRDPSLAGKILVEWTIAPNGRVVQVKTKYSSLRGGAVPGCIASRIRTWQFPKPKGGGHVVVNYPFMFESVGF